MNGVVYRIKEDWNKFVLPDRGHGLLQGLPTTKVTKEGALENPIHGGRQPSSTS